MDVRRDKTYSEGDKTMATRTNTIDVGNVIATQDTKGVIAIRDIRTNKIIARIPKEVAMDTTEAIEIILMMTEE
jgi:uncharacterized FlaG/YvyC family protein